MISILPDGNFIINNKKGKYKLSSNNNNFLTQKFNVASNGFTSIVAAENTTSNQQTVLEEQSLNLKFAYNMNQYVRTSDDVSFTNLTVTGNTFLHGDLTIIPEAISKYQTTVVNIGDTLIELASNNLTDDIDIGLYGKYVANSTTKYAGIFRDAQNNGIFKLFKDITIQPGSHINLVNNLNQADLMLNTLYTGYIKTADFYTDINIQAKNGTNDSINGGNIILSPGLAYLAGSTGNIILNNLSLASNTETLLAITSDGKIRNTSLTYSKVPLLNSNNILTINYTEAKVKSVNGLTGDVNISLSNTGVTSINGLTGNITGIPTLTSANIFTNTNTFNNSVILSGINTDTTISSSQKLMILDTTSNAIQRINITPDTLLTTINTQTISGEKTFNTDKLKINNLFSTTSTLTLKDSSVTTLDIMFNNKVGTSTNGWITFDPNGSGNSGIAFYDNLHIQGTQTITSTLTLAGVNFDTAISSGQKLMVLNTSTNNVQRINLTPDTINTTNTNQTITSDKTYSGTNTFNKVNITNNNILEFGLGVGGKEENAGKMGYQIYTSGALDMVGAGSSSGNRNVQISDNLNVSNNISSTNATISATTQTNNLTVNNNATISETTQTNNLTVNNNATISGTTQTNNLTVNNNAIISGILQTSNMYKITGSLTLNAIGESYYRNVILCPYNMPSGFYKATFFIFDYFLNLNLMFAALELYFFKYGSGSVIGWDNISGTNKVLVGGDNINVNFYKVNWYDAPSKGYNLLEITYRETNFYLGNSIQLQYTFEFIHSFTN